MVGGKLGAVAWAVVQVLWLTTATHAQDADTDVTFDASIAFEEEYRDNIFSTTNNTESDLITRVAPRAELGVTGEGFDVRLLGSLEAAHYADFEDEDYLDAQVGASGTFDATSDVTLFGGAEHAWAHEQRDSPDDANGIEPTLFRRAGAHAGFEYAPGTLSTRFGVNFNDFDFDSTKTSLGSLDNDDRDRLMSEAGGRITRTLEDGTGLFVQGAYDRRDYRSNDAVRRDSDGFNAAIGVSGTISQVTGEILAGVISQDYDDPGLEDVTTFDVGAALTWRPAPLTRVRFSLDRSLEETTVSETDGGVTTFASGYVSTSGGARVSHRVAPQVTLGASIGYDVNRYSGIDRTDYLGSIGVDARYYFLPHLYLGAGFRHVERNSNVAGADYDSNAVTLRLGAQMQPEYSEGAPLALDTDGGFYVGTFVSHSSLVTAIDGPRGRNGSNVADFGDTGFGGGILGGYQTAVNSVRLGLEADVDFSTTEWTHNGGRTFSVRKRDEVGVSALAGYDLMNGSFAFVRAGVVSARFDNEYARGTASNNFDERELGLRAGVGLEVPLTESLSGRVEYALTSYDDYNAGSGAPADGADNFSSVQGSARLGLVYHFGAQATASEEQEPVDFGGAYLGAQGGYSSLVSDNVGARSNFTLDASRSGHGAELGVLAGYGETFGDFYVGGELDAAISSANWNIERDPTGRVYSVEKNHTLGAALRLGYVLNDTVLLYARGGPVVTQFENDYATGGSEVSTTENQAGLRLGGGIEVGVSENLRLQLDYSHTTYDSYDVVYGNGQRDSFDNSETLFRAGVLYSF